MLRTAAAAATAVLGVVVLTAGCTEGEAASPVQSRAPGPADAYLDAVLDVAGDEVAQRHLEAEESIAACMAAQGFEYVPDTSQYHSVDPADIEPPPGSREFAEQFGYGFAAAPEGMRVESATTANPNEAITAEMSPEQYDAYTAALWGAEEGELGGCQRAARDAIWGDVETDPVRAALEEEIARIDTEVVPADAAVAEAAAAWADCMADAGVPGYTDPAEAEAAAWDRWLAFNGEIAANPDLGAEISEGEVAGQGDIAAQEAAVATADWDCRVESGYDDVWHETRDRLQQEYVDAHRAELEAWVESFS